MLAQRNALCITAIEGQTCFGDTFTKVIRDHNIPPRSIEFAFIVECQIDATMLYYHCYSIYMV